MSSDPRDKRLRCSVMIESTQSRIIIDTSPDFRQQMLKYNVNSIDGILYTHHHFDHIGGFDDIRAFNYTSHKPVPIYLQEKTLKELKRTFIYAFEEPEQKGGGVPISDIHIIDEEIIEIKDIQVQPIKLIHGCLDIRGFRVGDFAYLTDTNKIPEESYKKLEGLEVLVIDALRYTQHSTHFSVDEAINEITRIKPKKAYLTHIAHQIKHEEAEKKLPKNIFILYDGMVFDLINNK